VKIIRDKISRQDMAKMVGASREMVSRVMKDLEERALSRRDGQRRHLIKERLNSLGIEGHVRTRGRGLPLRMG
jgi:CRP/FNR family cyclic AMP-dependent transcriptional regulator